MEQKAIGMSWYREADYDALLRIFEDSTLLPASFTQWQEKAEKGRNRYIGEGYIVIKAYIDPATFPAWCAAHGCSVDANGRLDFTNAEAHRILMEANRQS